MVEVAVLIYDEVSIDSPQFDAILFTIEGRAVWIPRSQVLDYDEAAREVTVPEWLAINEGLA